MRDEVASRAAGRRITSGTAEDELTDDGRDRLEELLTAEQLAALLLVRKSTVEDYARRGLLPSLKLGRHRRFVRSDVIGAIDELRHTGH
jgi:excisionase family DNA binding protein